MRAAIWEHSIWLREIDPRILRDSFTAILEEAGFGILRLMEHHFKPQGWSALWLIAESHLAIHTFPEEETAYVQLSSCNRDFFVAFLLLLDREFPTG